MTPPGILIMGKRDATENRPAMVRLLHPVARVASCVTVLALVFCIRSYQVMVRPLLVGSCKFCPTCSDYGIESLLTHGPWRGALLTLRRVCRCHPFSAGGLDPVPQPQSLPGAKAAD